MPRAFHRLSAAAALAATVGLVACGSAQPSASVQTAQQPAVVVTSAPTTAAPTKTTRSFSDIPQSTTVEGHHVLGAANAPVTLVMYSDFL